MSVVHKWLFTTLIFINILCFVNSALDNGSSDDNMRDQRDFVIFHLQRGYNAIREKNPCHFKGTGTNNEPDCAFSLQFYIHATKCCSVVKEDALPPRDIICFEDGHCIDIGDPGIHP